MPILQGSPNVSHLGEGDFPATFTAVLHDYCGGGEVAYRWRSTDANVHIASPSSPSTQVTVDSVSKPTVWPYNQVNDETGMGAVATWRGLPLRMAKISNFLVGYTTKRIGVWSVSRGLSQGIGTHNDESASMSWDAGVAVADGAGYEGTTGSINDGENSGATHEMNCA